MLGDSASELIDQFGSETFRAVHESDQDGLIYFDGAGRIEYANRAALELFGLDDDVIGENIFALDEENYENLPVDPIYPSDHFDKARRTYEEGVPTRSELVVVSGDERREVEVVWGPVENDGEITGIVGSYRDVSPRPDIHDQLSVEATRLDEERRFLATVLDALDDGLVVFDERGTVELLNPSARDLLDLETPAEGMELEAFLRAANLDSPEKFAEHLRHTAGNHGDSRFHCTIRAGDDEMRRVEVEFVPTNVGHERIICTLAERAFHADRRRMKLLAALGDLEPRARPPVELGDDIAARIVDELQFDFAIATRFRDGQLEPLGWRGVMLDRAMTVEVEPESPLGELLESATPGHLEQWPWQAPDGRTSLEHIAIPLVAGGATVGTLHLGFSSTSGSEARSTTSAFEQSFARALGNQLGEALHAAERRRRTEARRERVRQLVETLPMGIILYNRRGEVVLYNRRFADLTGYDEWDNLNTDSRPFRLLDSDGSALPRSEWPMFRAVREGAPCSETLRLERAGEAREVLVGGSPLGTDDASEASDDLFVGRLRDVTEQRRLNRRKDEFLSIASHELRSPLTPLTGVLQLARRQRERGEEVDLSLLTRAERQVTRLARLIDGLLDLTRIETDRIELEPQSLELGAFVEDQLEPWHLHPKDVELVVDRPDTPVRVHADPDRIGQVLTNVVDNAIEYSKPDGVICIEVTESGSHARIVVEDDGVGMDQETVDRIFDRFYHGAEGGDARSMGLGLYICRQIVEEHHGDISVESEEGEGTRVDITLPRRPPDDALAN